MLPNPPSHLFVTSFFKPTGQLLLLQPLDLLIIHMAFVLQSRRIGCRWTTLLTLAVFPSFSNIQLTRFCINFVSCCRIVGASRDNCTSKEWNGELFVRYAILFWSALVFNFPPKLCFLFNLHHPYDYDYKYLLGCDFSLIPVLLRSRIPIHLACTFYLYLHVSFSNHTLILTFVHSGFGFFPSWFGMCYFIWKYNFLLFPFWFEHLFFLLFISLPGFNESKFCSNIVLIFLLDFHNRWRSEIGEFILFSFSAVMIQYCCHELCFRLDTNWI